MHVSDITDRCPLDASSNAMQHHEGMSEAVYSVKTYKVTGLAMCREPIAVPWHF